MKVPTHIAIIMDGNGRWARQRKKPRIFGHRAGIRAVREVVEACGELGIKYLTLYSFSVENWSRPASEVNSLMRFLQTYLRKEVLNLMENNVRLKTIGRTHQLPAAVQEALSETIQKTSQNNGLTLVLALNYGGRTEIVDAVNRIIEQYKQGQIEQNRIDEDFIARSLDTCGMPDP
ncbi:MAG: polyprenyl diphosphate synthase, partial [Chlamydiota bacterium]|nr:polyprenyl diphosphate synthase [Chlamydiota bacterium]